MILGIDWGASKIGLAIAYNDMPIATALSIVKNDQCVFDKIHEVIEKYDIDCIVVGRSTHKTHTDCSKKIDYFMTQCKEQCGIKNIVTIDEIFSTRQAQYNLKDANKKNITQHDDAEAARIILQQYLDA